MKTTRGGRTYAAARTERQLAGEAQGTFQVDIRATFPVRKVDEELNRNGARRRRGGGGGGVGGGNNAVRAS